MFDAPFFAYRNDRRSPIDLLEWEIPKPAGDPYQSPFNLGIMRLAFEVDDIDEAYWHLRALLERHHRSGNGKGRKNPTERTYPVSTPETWDMGDFGARKVVIFRDPDGVYLELIERPKYPSEMT